MIAAQITPVMVTLADMDEITVKSRVPEADIGSACASGQKARFVTLAGEAQRHEGRVRVIQLVPERVGNAGVLQRAVRGAQPRRPAAVGHDGAGVDRDRAGETGAGHSDGGAGARDDDGRHSVQVLGSDGKSARAPFAPVAGRRARAGAKA